MGKIQDYLQHKYDKYIKDLTYWPRLLPVIIKYFFVILMAAISYSTVFSLPLNKVAMYTYSAYQGIRFPTEGVPYLDLFVLFFSGVVIFSVGVLLTIVFWLIAISSKTIRRTFVDGKDSRLDMPTFKEITYKYSNTVVMAAFVYAAFKIGVGISGEAKFIPELLIVSALAVAIFFPHIFYLLYKNPKKFKIAATAIIPFVTTAIIWGIFLCPRMYSGMLNIVGFGGNAPIRITCKDERSCVNNEVGLLLRTKTSLLLYDSLTSTYHEVPIKEIKKISYKKKGL